MLELKEKHSLAYFDEIANIEWITIPEGPFLMGAGNADDEAQDNERPMHRIDVDAYNISKYPVTQKQYAEFIEATGYPRPSIFSPDFTPTYPVFYVSWYDAVAFCEWSGSRLPSEAEWEKAARGNDGRLYPWGNTKPDETLCDFANSTKGNTPVDKYPSGASPYGVMDMIGNIWEWCNDWYHKDYYLKSHKDKPVGPEHGVCRVFKGGGWDFIGNSSLRCSFRGYFPPYYNNHAVGFRVVSS